jgi:hypothetical protein
LCQYILIVFEPFIDKPMLNLVELILQVFWLGHKIVIDIYKKKKKIRILIKINNKIIILQMLVSEMHYFTIVNKKTWVN